MQLSAFALAKDSVSILYELHEKWNTRLQAHALAVNCHSSRLTQRHWPGSILQLISENLCVERGSRPVLKGLSFRVGSGEALVLTGPNGAGKTTLLRALAGFLKPATGTIVLQGGEVDKVLSEQCHVVGHASALKSSLTVAENVAFWAVYLGGPNGAETRTSRALEYFSLSDLSEFPAGYLSAGQKRRVGLARLLAAERAIWLLDEPTVSLDTASSKMLSDAVNAHTAKGGIAIAATHLALGLKRARELQLGAKASPA